LLPHKRRACYLYRCRHALAFALAEPNRRAILQLVSHEARAVGDILAYLDITSQALPAT
jgi:DNA-binding transcriptional ArsR family regulator